MDFIDYWKFESIKLAAMEQLEIQGKITPSVLFKRARVIFEKGNENKIEKWSSIWTEEKPKKTKSESKKEKVVVKRGLKKCPSCGEEVPASWNRHVYKKDGSKCGHEF